MDIKPTFSGDLTRTLSTKKSWAAILPFLINAIGLLPIHRDSKRGRSRAMQVRIALLVIGIICIAFGKTTIFLSIGLLLCFLILFIPLSESRKRNWIAGLKRASVKTKTETREVDVVLEKKKIHLSNAIFKTVLKRKKPRKISSDGFVYVGFRDENQDRFWFRAEGEKEEWPSFEKNELVINLIDASFEKVMELSRG